MIFSEKIVHLAEEAERALAEHFDLPLKDWYPEGLAPTTPQQIDWQTLVQSIDNYCNLEAESRPLKRGDSFEELRNNYKYREECRSAVFHRYP